MVSNIVTKLINPKWVATKWINLILSSDSRLCYFSEGISVWTVSFCHFKNKCPQTNYSLFLTKFISQISCLLPMEPQIYNEVFQTSFTLLYFMLPFFLLKSHLSASFPGVSETSIELSLYFTLITINLAQDSNTSWVISKAKQIITQKRVHRVHANSYSF